MDDSAYKQPEINTITALDTQGMFEALSKQTGSQWERVEKKLVHASKMVGVINQTGSI